MPGHHSSLRPVSPLLFSGTWAWDVCLQAGDEEEERFGARARRAVKDCDGGRKTIKIPEPGPRNVITTIASGPDWQKSVTLLLVR